MTTPSATATAETADQGMKIRDLEEELERVRQELKSQKRRAEEAETSVKHIKDEMDAVLEASQLDREKTKAQRRTAERSRDHYLEQVISYREQRDEARAELTKCNKESNAAKEEGVTYRKERDETRRETHDLRKRLETALLKIDTACLYERDLADLVAQRPDPRLGKPICSVHLAHRHQQQYSTALSLCQPTSSGCSLSSSYNLPSRPAIVASASHDISCHTSSTSNTFTPPASLSD
jgi:DNA repair exonuclease SbcCD ATPase subunit